ncbi:KGG domain-containing protein [Lysobacter sp. HA35]
MDLDTQTPTPRGGFNRMDPNRQREIASMGGRAAHARGNAHEFSANEARDAGRKGGQAVSRNRDHMAAIGRKGGQAVSGNREHMAAIGRRGGEATRGVMRTASTATAQ